MGSGRTAEAAVELGRKFVGLDLSLEYCRMARRCLSNAITKEGKALAQREEKEQIELF